MLVLFRICARRRIVVRCLAGLAAGLAGHAAWAQDGAAHLVPMFPAASDEVRQGFVRVVSHSRRAGDWRLELTSDLDIEVLAYIRTTTDGFLTAMHDTVAREGHRHRVATFNPGANVNQASLLRLVNAGDESAQVTIRGIDDAGERSSGRVSISVPPATSRTLTAQELEAGGDGFEGLGDGAGKWQLVVESEQPILVMSLLSSPTGHLTNLSTAPAVDFAPANPTVFDDRAVGRRIVGDDPAAYVDFLSAGRFRETEGGATYEGGYTYTRAAPNRATVVLDYDDGDRCTYELTFRSRTSGRLTYTCNDGDSGESNWHLVDRPGNQNGTRIEYGVDDTITTLPTGTWTPDRTSGSASVVVGSGKVVIELGDGAFIEEGDYRYTCESAGGCRIDDRVVTSGTVVEMSISETQAPDLVVESPSVRESHVEPGASFTLSGTVRNAGDGNAAATTLRYYRSSDESVSTADTEVGTEAIIALPVSATAHGSITVEAPLAAGTYHYGACVDGVPGESDSRNNCSGAVQLSVGVDGPTEGEDFDLDPDNTYPRGIAYANGRFHVVDYSDAKVYAYTVHGGRDASFDFDLASGNDRPGRIVHADDSFFVAETSEGKLYAYEPDGRRDEDADLDLDGDNSRVAGIAFGNDRIYVADYWDARLYVYGCAVRWTSRRRPWRTAATSVVHAWTMSRARGPRRTTARAPSRSWLGNDRTST